MVEKERFGKGFWAEIGEYFGRSSERERESILVGVQRDDPDDVTGLRGPVIRLSARHPFTFSEPRLSSPPQLRTSRHLRTIIFHINHFHGI